MSDDETRDPQAETTTASTADDDLTMAEMIGEGVEVGHGGMPIFLVVCIVLVFLWAMVAWKPWGGY